MTGALLALVVLVAVGCEEDETATPTPATATATGTATASPTATGTATTQPTGTETATATETGTATETATETATATETGTTDDRAAIIAQFPADVQPLLETVWSTELLQLLLDVRNSGADSIVWQDAGGEFNEGMQRAFNREWEQITGWTINYVSVTGDSNAVITEMVNAGATEWDVSEIGSYGSALRMETEGLFEPIDQTYFPDEHYPSSTLTSENWASVIDYGTTLIYNTEAFDEGNAPTKIADLFDIEKYPDQIRCLYDGAQFGWNLEYALLADGVPVEELYTVLGTPEGVERAFAKLDTIKDNMVLWAAGAESVQFILDGQCDFGTTWNGRPALRIRDEPDLPLGMSWDGAFLDGDPFAIIKGTEKYDAALSALAYALDPTNQCDLENTLAYGNIMDVEPFPDCLNEFARVWGPDPALTLPIPPDPNFWREHDNEYLDAWNTWKTE
jgi:putative spermidine/putrescine transport system substrate-binding protein